MIFYIQAPRHVILPQITRQIGRPLTMIELDR